MTATIGPGDIALYESTRPKLLRLIAGVEPEPKGTRALEPFGIRSVQRLLISDVGGGGVVVAFWPAELKPQAEFLYSNGRGKRW